MKHLGIDLGATHSHVVVMDSSGELVERRKIRTAELPAYLERQPLETRVVMETCTQSRTIAMAARRAGHHVTVVPGQVVRALGVGARGIKTDDRDAEVLARASVRSPVLPSVHLRSELAQERRDLVAARASLLEARRSLGLKVKSWLRGRLQSVRGRANSRAFCEAVRRVASEHSGGLPRALEALLCSFEQLTVQIDALTEEVDAIAAQDPVCARLQTVVGVGPLVALAFTSCLDDPMRFSSADELASYLALSPGEATTGGKVVRTGTIHAGPRELKALLVQAAWVAWRYSPSSPMVLWAKSIEARRNRRVAIIALARKLATVMWAMWKHGTVYDPARAARVPSSTVELAA